MAIVAAGVAVLGGVATAVISAKKAKKTRNAISEYKRQDLKNAYADVEVSTLSADLQREELARATASSVQLLKQGGVRSAIGGVGHIQETNVLASRAIGADLDRQQKNIDQLKAGDNARLQQMMEAREAADLAGLGAQLNVQNQATMNGINTAVSGIGSAASAVGAMGGGAGGGGGALGGGADSIAAASKFTDPRGALAAVGANNPYLPTKLS